MSFLLVASPNGSCADEALMEALGAAAELRNFRRVTTLCQTLGHPVTEFIGSLDSQEIRIGGDLLLAIPVAYTVHLCVTGRPTRQRKRLRFALAAKLEAAGFHIVTWPTASAAA